MVDSYTFNGEESGNAKASKIEDSNTNHTQGFKVAEFDPENESWEEFQKRTK